MKKCLIVGAMAALTSLGLASSTLPVSYTTSVVAVPAANGGASTLISIPVHDTPVHSSPVASVSTDDVTLATPLPAALPTSPASGDAQSWVAVVKTGDSVGEFFSIDPAASTASVLRLTGLSASSVTLTSADVLEVVPEWTLSRLFDKSNLDGSVIEAVSTQLGVSSGGSFSFYWLNSTSGWTAAGSTTGGDSNDVVIPFGTSVFLTNRNLTDSFVSLSGVAYDERTSTPVIPGGGTEFVSVPFFADVTLSEITAQMNGSVISAVADQIALESGGSFTFYWLNSSNGNLVDVAGVQPDITPAQQASTLISAGKGYGLLLRAAGSVSLYKPLSSF